VKSSQLIISARSRLLAVVQILLNTVNSDIAVIAAMPSSRIPSAALPSLGLLAGYIPYIE